MKKYKFSVKDRIKTDLHFVWMFLGNRKDRVDAKWYRDFMNAWDEYHENDNNGMYSSVSGKTYGVLVNALNSVDSYRMISQEENDAMAKAARQ